MVAGILPWRPENPIQEREVDGRPINSWRVPSRCQRTTVPRLEGGCFQTFTLPEDRCVRLLVKNLDRGMPESVVREEPESLNIRFQGVTQLRSGSREQDPSKDRPPNTPTTSLYQWRVVLRCRKYEHPPNSAACECRWNHTWPRKAHWNASAANALGTRSETAVTHPGASRVGAPTSPVVVLPRENSPIALAAGETSANYRGRVKWKEAKDPLAKQAPDRARKSRHSPTYRSERTASRALCRGDEPGRGVESPRSKRPCCQGHYPINPYSKSPFLAGHGSFREI